MILSCLVFLTGCICPKSNDVEFDNTSKILKVLSEGFYIEDVTITECVQKEGYVSLINTNRSTIKQIEGSKANTLNLIHPGKNFRLEGIPYSKLMGYELLYYEVRIAYENGNQNKDGFDRDYIFFVQNRFEKGQTTFGSSHPCP